MARHLIHTPATLATCEPCGAHVITGVSDGTVTVVNPGVLTLSDELAVRMRGRRTFDLVVTGIQAHELWYRDQYRIRTRQHPVLGEHKCRDGGIHGPLPQPPVPDPNQPPPF